MTLTTSSISGVGISAGLYAVVSNPAQVGAVPEEAKDKAHHLKSGRGFVNPWDSYTETSPWQLFKTQLTRMIKGTTKTPDTTPPTVNVVKPQLHPTRETPKLRATWLGHACYYIEFPSGLRVLFDPVFEDCCAPINFSKVRRFTPPPCEIEDLPFVDAVVISHSHYDHLSYPTTQRISKAFPEAWFFVPLGNEKWFRSCGIERVTELDWWEEREITLTVTQKGCEKDTGSVSVSSSQGGNIRAEEKITATLSCLPCQHTAARTPFDKNHTLWASWSVTSTPLPSPSLSSSSSTPSVPSSVYFAGDTGYRAVPRLDPSIDDYSAPYAHLPICPAFKHIGQHRGPFDLGLIPIGAYEPRWMWSAMHADPKDAVNIFLDTRCRTALGMHWGTWVLTEEDVLEPPRKLKEACEWKGVREGVFGVLEIGGSREVESGSLT